MFINQIINVVFVIKIFLNLTVMSSGLRAVVIVNFGLRIPNFEFQTLNSKLPTGISLPDKLHP